MRTTASQGIVMWESWSRMPRCSSQAARPTHRPVTRSFGRGQLAAEVVAAAERAAGLGDDLAAQAVRRASSSACSRDPVEVGSQAVVAAAEAELGRSALQLDGGVDSAQPRASRRGRGGRRRSSLRACRSSRRAAPSSRARRGSRRLRASRPGRPRSRGRRRCRSAGRPCRAVGGRARCSPMSISLPLNSGPRS